MREQELLFQVLNSDETVGAEVKHWLDDAFDGVHELAEDTNNKHLKFSQYDPLSFVVTFLNFLREETAPLLAPSGERSQTIDHPSPASSVAIKESVAGECSLDKHFDLALSKCATHDATHSVLRTNLSGIGQESRRR